LKKVGIINFHYSNNNYGAVLQASSISSVISDLGYSVEHIDYIPQKNTDNEPLKLLNGFQEAKEHFIKLQI